LFSSGAVLGGLIISAWGGYKNHMKTIAMSCYDSAKC
jgi:DHA3 family macrolide efflux protein-like MFS transporter